MAEYEIWGRKQLGKGSRQKLAYGIPSEEEARRVRNELIAKGFADCIPGRTPRSYAPHVGIGKKSGKPRKTTGTPQIGALTN